MTVHSGSYWLQNVARKSYLGATTTLYAITKSYTKYLPWTLTVRDDDEDGVVDSVVLRHNYKKYYLFYNTSKSYFSMTSSSANVNDIYFWRESEPTILTRYTTFSDD